MTVEFASRANILRLPRHIIHFLAEFPAPIAWGPRAGVITANMDVFRVYTKQLACYRMVDTEYTRK